MARNHRFLSQNVTIFINDQSENMYEDPDFPAKNLAALVASKAYFYLGEYNESMNFALGAGDLFDLNEKSEYVDTIISCVIDSYIQKYQHNVMNPEEAREIEQHLSDVAMRMIERCIVDKEFKQAVGIALKAMNLELLHEIIRKSDYDLGVIDYTFKCSITTIQFVKFRTEVMYFITNFRCLKFLLRSTNK